MDVDAIVYPKGFPKCFWKVCGEAVSLKMCYNPNGI